MLARPPDCTDVACNVSRVRQRVLDCARRSKATSVQIKGSEVIVHPPYPLRLPP